MNVFETIFVIIFLISIFFLLLFVYPKVIRLFKKKSHHYIIPPKPNKDRNWKPIEFSNYNCYIIMSDNNFLISELKNQNYLERLKTITSNNIFIEKTSKEILLKVDNASFFDFKTLVSSLYNLAELNNHFHPITGFCQHKTNPTEDYLFKLDSDTMVTNFIGAFRTNKNFGIYLPFADLNKAGNISLSRNYEINFYDEVSKIPLEILENYSFNESIRTIANNVDSN